VRVGRRGLSGGVRPGPQGGERVREGAKLGFKRAVVPGANRPRKDIKGLEVSGVKGVGEALGAVAQAAA